MPVERTTLAWLRTTLAFMVGAIIMTRLIAQQSALLAIGHAALTIPLGATITLLFWRRHVRNDQSLRSAAPLPDAILPAAVAALAVFVGSAGLTYTLISS